MCSCDITNHRAMPIYIVDSNPIDIPLVKRADFETLRHLEVRTER